MSSSSYEVNYWTTFCQREILIAEGHSKMKRICSEVTMASLTECFTECMS